MSTGLDVERLIAEIKKRPALWNVCLPVYKDRTQTMRLWQEVAENVGFDVEQCKRKWKNLRDAYRAEIRRTERRVMRLKLEGYNDPQVSESKWAYFQPMSFMNDSKRKRYAATTSGSNEHSNESQEGCIVETVDNADIKEFCHIKMEPQNSTDDEYGMPGVTGDETMLPDDDDDVNDMLFEEFKSVATPQAARRLSGTLTLGSGIGSFSPSTSTPTPIALPPSTTTTIVATVAGNSNGNQVATSAAPPSSSNCKCSQRAEDQVHFLEDLEREEQQLMQSTRRDITRANSLTHFGDSDYNFLVSFLPQMKRLSELQNLQFRAKMSELMLCIMAQQPLSTPIATTSSTPNFGCISTTTPTINPPHHDTHAATTTTTTILQHKKEEPE